MTHLENPTKGAGVSQPEIQKGTKVQMRRGLPVGESVAQWLIPGDILTAEGSPDMHRGFWATLMRNGVPVRRYWLVLGEVDILPSEPPEITE